VILLGHLEAHSDRNRLTMTRDYPKCSISVEAGEHCGDVVEQLRRLLCHSVEELGLARATGHESGDP
jgi:hypothetical protein